MSHSNSQYVSENRKLEIIALAESIADKHCPKGRVDPVVIMDSSGITKSKGNYQDHFEALLECLDSKFHVYLNLDANPDPFTGRGLFTLAHEIGHCNIPEHRAALMAGEDFLYRSQYNPRTNLRIEREANLFASNLLLPQNRLLNFQENESDAKGLFLVKEMAEFFKTSTTMTAIRLIQESKKMCAVFQFDTNGKVLWQWRSGPFHQIMKGKWIDNIDGLDTVTKEAFNSNGSMENGDILEGETNISNFYPKLMIGKKFKEYVIKKGPYGYLTYLCCNS